MCEVCLVQESYGVLMMSRHGAGTMPPAASPRTASSSQNDGRRARDEGEPAHGKGGNLLPSLSVAIVDEDGEVVAIEMLTPLE